MFDPAYIDKNGIAIQSVDMGMEYSKDGKTVSIIGESDSGEIHLNDVFVGNYERNDNGTFDVTAADGSLLTTIDSTEDAFEAYAATFLL